jgi:hypothetical protein
MHAYFTSAVQSAQTLASQFDGDCAPSSPAPLVAAGVRRELRTNATRWQTNKNQNMALYPETGRWEF